jgi:hypothetical protein
MTLKTHYHYGILSAAAVGVLQCCRSTYSQVAVLWPAGPASGLLLRYHCIVAKENVYEVGFLPNNTHL